MVITVMKGNFEKIFFEYEEKLIKISFATQIKPKAFRIRKITSF